MLWKIIWQVWHLAVVRDNPCPAWRPGWILWPEVSCFDIYSKKVTQNLPYFFHHRTKVFTFLSGKKKLSSTCCHNVCEGVCEMVKSAFLRLAKQIGILGHPYFHQKVVHLISTFFCWENVNESLHFFSTFIFRLNFGWKSQFVWFKLRHVYVKSISR